ncbi:hypothetical protein [Actinokineospora cianjurensis]|uniref:hypothetical protein n=1 Tax=Actinokineospora cianjurensis TaxID=585224 RepID=UPI000EB33DC9|nr:hypothetical protein [Actinokineospora cianjurensis]
MEQDLRAALLVADDLPTGFKASEVPGLDDGSLAGCPLLANDPPGTTATSSAVFVHTVGTTVSESLLHVGDRSGEAMAAFDTLAQVCARFEGTLFDTTLEFTTTRAAPPAVGDAAVAVRIAISLPGGPTLITQDVVVVSHGGTVIVVSVLLAPDDGFLPSVVTRAVQKVAARW